MNIFANRALWLGFVVASAVAFLVWAHFTDLRLAKEVSELEHERRDLVRVQRDNADLAAAVARLAPSPRAAPAARQARAVRGPVPLAPGFKGRADLENVGTAAVEDAFQTFLWAIDHGEAGALEKVIVLSDAARAEINEAFARLPVAEQEKYGSAAQMFALLYVYSNPLVLSGLEIGNPSATGPDQTTLETKWQFPAGQIRDHPIPLYRTAEGWKVIVPDLKVEEIVHRELEVAP
jgi:hypothetical protein